MLLIGQDNMKNEKTEQNNDNNPSFNQNNIDNQNLAQNNMNYPKFNSNTFNDNNNNYSILIIIRLKRIKYLKTQE